jgi:hypothetical protein
MGGYIGQRRRQEMLSKFLLENHSEDIGVYRRMILKLIFETCGGSVWTGFIWLRIGINGGSCVMNLRFP